MMASAVHLLENAVHPSEAPEEHDGLCSTLDVKYSTPSEPHEILDGNLMTANVVHPGEAPEVNDGLCSTLAGKCSTPSEAPDVHDDIYSTPVGKCNCGSWPVQHT